MSDKLLATHVFSFNEEDNGGEQLILTTKFYDNGDDKKQNIYLNQQLTLQSHCNAASFELIGTILTPALLQRSLK
jgi:hypothetical protein